MILERRQKDDGLGAGCGGGGRKCVSVLNNKVVRSGGTIVACTKIHLITVAILKGFPPH